MKASPFHTILIVTDSPPTAGLKPGFLCRPDIRMVDSPHDAQAIHVARRVAPSLIIESCPTNGSADLELFGLLRTDRETRSIPLILVAPPEVGPMLGEPRPDALVARPIVQREYYEAVARFIPLPRRRVLRHAVNLRFTYRAGETTGQAFSRDLSLHGAFLKTDRALSAGEHLEVCFTIPGQVEEVRCGAVVRRSAPYTLHSPQLSGFAIEFEGIRENDLARLEEFIQRQLRRPPFLF